MVPSHLSAQECALHELQLVSVVLWATAIHKHTFTCGKGTDCRLCYPRKVKYS
jgi:hypothetical protein